MSGTQDLVKQGLDRMNAIIGYWANLPTNNALSGGTAQLNSFASIAQDLQKLYGEAYQRHLDPFLSENQKGVERCTALMLSRDPGEAVAIRAELLQMIMEGAALRADIWSDLASKLGHRYAEFVREYAQSFRPKPDEVAAKKPVAKAA